MQGSTPKIGISATQARTRTRARTGRRDQAAISVVALMLLSACAVHPGARCINGHAAPAYRVSPGSDPYYNPGGGAISFGNTTHLPVDTASYARAEPPTPSLEEELHCMRLKDADDKAAAARASATKE